MRTIKNITIIKKCMTGSGLLNLISICYGKSTYIIGLMYTITGNRIHSLTQPTGNFIHLYR